mgnify:FL=1
MATMKKTTKSQSHHSMLKKAHSHHEKAAAAHERAAEHHKEAKKWIQSAIRHPGALHESLHVPEGKKIPMARLEKAEHSKNPTLARRARLAETLRGLKKK